MNCPQNLEEKAKIVTVRIRHAVLTDAPGIAKVHVDSWRTTYVGIVPDEYLASLSYSARQQVWENILKAHKPDNCIIVAVTLDGAIVGFAHAGPERETGYDAELYAIYLLQEYQGGGVGRRLTTAVSRGVLNAGMTSMMLWVLEDNYSARRFYEALDGAEVERKCVRIGGVQLMEIAYGWQNIRSLLR